MDFDTTFNGGDQTPNRDKDESDPLSYNSRPFNTNNSIKGMNENRYGTQSK